MSNLSNADLPVAFFYGDISIFVNSGNTAFAAMIPYNGIFFIHCKIGNIATGLFADFNTIFIICIKNSPSVGFYRSDYYFFYPRQIIQVMNIRNT